LEGIAKAKAAGVYKGRRPSVDVSQVRALKQKGTGPSAIVKTMGIQADDPPITNSVFDES
jgi:hypothetical protein